MDNRSTPFEVNGDMFAFDHAAEVIQDFVQFGIGMGMRVRTCGDWVVVKRKQDITYMRMPAALFLVWVDSYIPKHVTR